MGLDDQLEEREVLDSIFPNEITDISDTAYRISISLDVIVQDGDESKSPIIILQVNYPKAYPDEAPQLEISAPPNAPKHALFDIQEDRPGLMEALLSTIEENMGMAMIFTLVSTLKDSAELLISERQQAVQALEDVQKARAEEAENRKFHGTAVTIKSFLEWRGQFKKEMEDDELKRKEEKEAEDKKKRGPKEEKKLTGRELWEKGLVGKIEEDEEGGDALEGIHKLKMEE
ncbi:MAG: hypothetical protein M1812_001848 [Candelaria pacifica]|nr:MAG: hypothetical protein M1812_001848 [Candelaria pacifica]